MTNLYFNNVKMLLERISSVMIDSVALEHLIGYVEDCLKGGNSIEEIGLNPSTAGERGVRLIQVKIYYFSFAVFICLRYTIHSFLYFRFYHSYTRHIILI